MISLAAWVIDGGTFHIQDCKAANSFLMVSNDGARLRATEFVVVNPSAAGVLVSSGEVTMRASVKQRCVGYCCFNMQVAVSAWLSVLGNRVPATEVTASSIRQVPRNSGPTAGALLLLQLCKTSKKRNDYADIIGFIMFVQRAETQRSKNISEILSKHTKGIFDSPFLAGQMWSR